MSKFDPENRDLLRFHYECLQGMYFSEYHRLDSGVLLFSDLIKDPYYNFFSPESAASGIVPPPDVIAEFTRRDRQAAVYLTPLVTWPDGGSEPEVEVWARDAWLVGEVESLVRPGTEVPGVDTFLIDSGQREPYMAAFAAAYSGDDPTDPYGQLDPAYTESLSRSFDVTVPGYRKYYLMAVQDETPVGVAAMFTAGPLAGVYGVGTIPSHRKRGIGEAIMGHLARIAADDGVTHIMLQTEAGSRVQRWYEKLGYQERFTAPYVQISEEQRL